jgi:hypothetical protein
LVAEITGAYWDNGVYAGSRTPSLSVSPWIASASIGSRFACDAL